MQGGDENMLLDQESREVDILIEGQAQQKLRTCQCSSRKAYVGAVCSAGLFGFVLLICAPGELRKLRPEDSVQSWERSSHVVPLNIELLAWDKALAKANKTEALMTHHERMMLIGGKGFVNPELGYWVGVSPPIRRLGIPSLKLQDSAGGFRPTAPHEFGTSTCWPSLLSLAATWDDSRVETVASAIAMEFRGKGANVLLGPGVNVHRTARGGRNFEYLSGEDPFLGSRLTRAFVQGVQRQGVMAVVKHWAFNEQETGRHWQNSVVDAKTAWELYYPPFEAAIEAGAGAFMCSYNRVNGTHACSNEELLNRDLRGAMGFQGFVMSDWGATTSENSLDAGLDMEEPKHKYFSQDKLSHDNGSSYHIRVAARHILTSIYHLRLDEHPGCQLPCRKERHSNQRTPRNLEIAQHTAREGVVLLKNDGVLPLSPGKVKSIALLGRTATARDHLTLWGPGSPYAGGGSGHVPAPLVVTPLEGIGARAKLAGISILHSLDYASEWRAAKAADVIIVVASATSWESRDRPSLSLPGIQDRFIMRLSELGKPVIVLLEIPGAVLTPWRDQVSAMACMFEGGERSGAAWADILFGDWNPSGKLPITMPLSEADTVKVNYNRTNNYTEQLLTSYRSPTYKAAYPFGFGLTYTLFNMSDPSIPADCPEVACVHVRITNVGNVPGSEVVQAYLEFPSELDEPKRVLRGFRRSKLLPPGAHEEINIPFTERDLSSYVVTQGWKRVRGEVKVHIGFSSEPSSQKTLRLSS